MKLCQCIIVMAAAFFLPGLAWAGVVVIANNSVTATKMSVSDVGQLFLGSALTLPDGSRAVVIDMLEGSPQRVEFSERILGKNEQQLRSYWTRMIFTGKGQPPRTVASAAEMLRLVANTPGAIGYVSSDEVPAKVKVLLRVE